MEKLPFRIYHSSCLLEQYAEQTLPLDLFVSFYFRGNKSLGSKDRGGIAETVYGVIRWRGLLDYLCGKPISWLDRVQLFQDFDPINYLKDDRIPLHVRVSFPKILFDLISESYGEKRAVELCWNSNFQAPTTVRVNLLKTTRSCLYEQWKDIFPIKLSQQSPCGIQFLKKIPFFSMPEFKEGLFEVQDEGSQLLADLVEAVPGELVMDYCAGSGGKTLAFAPKMNEKGQIFLHDVRARALIEARKRLKRAGIENAQVMGPDHPKLKQLKHKMDWILVDAPCSGTGTLRRNPDMKWRFAEDTVPRLTGLQRQIFEKALSFLKPGGRIVYGTCSLLQQENEEQAEHFLKTYRLELLSPPFHSFPKMGEMDGFYGTVMRRVE